jgi:hypothetical protein
MVISAITTAAESPEIGPATFFLHGLHSQSFALATPMQ